MLDVAHFLLDVEARRLSTRTAAIYERELRLCYLWLVDQGITQVEDVTANDLRGYLVHLQHQGRNAGGQNLAYRVLRTFLRWTWQERDLTIPSPLQRVHAPRPDDAPLPPANIEHIRAMLATCKGKGIRDSRDRAIMLALLDSGCRASEFVSLNVGDVNLATGDLSIRAGKGRKSRVAFIGS